MTMELRPAAPSSYRPIALRTLYISYFGALKHLSQTQVLPYLEGLAANGVDVTLLSFEDRWDDQLEEAAARRALRHELERQGISWFPRRYHRTPSLPATVWDVCVAIVTALYLVATRRIDVLHARSHVPAVPALIVKTLLRRKLVFDLRGTMAEEYADAGLWRRGGVLYRLTNLVERTAIRHADGVVMLTRRVREHFAKGLPEKEVQKIVVIPCCVDLSRYPRRGGQAEMRSGSRHGRVVAYVGSLGGWYLTDEMMQFFRVARRLDSRFHFLLVTQMPSEAITAVRENGLDDTQVTVKTVPPREMATVLQGADFAVSFIKPGLSKVSSSPTKVGEYLASGLPIIANRGIGDLDEIVERHRVGVLIDRFDDDSYRVALTTMLALLDGDPEVRNRCRHAAEQELSLEGIGVPRYVSLYRRLIPSGGKGFRSNDQE
jgi:glycosyltransferase involved in cell wall biosynthesis